MRRTIPMTVLISAECPTGAVLTALVVHVVRAAPYDFCSCRVAVRTCQVRTVDQGAVSPKTELACPLSQ